MILTQYPDISRPARAFGWVFCLLIPLLLSNPPAISGQDLQFTVPLYVSDGINSDTLYFGMHPGGTAGHDAGLDTLAPSPQTPADFDVAFQDTNNVRFAADIRDTVRLQKTYRVHYRTESDRKHIILRWNPDQVEGKGDFIITRKSPDGQQLPGIDMTQQDSLVLPDTLLKNREGVFSIKVHPARSNESPAIGRLPADTLIYSDHPSLSFDLDSVFSDPEADSLQFSAASSDTLITVPQIKHDSLTIIPGEKGKTTITLTASGQAGNTVQHSFSVSVFSPLSTDSTLGSLQLHPGDSYTFDDLNLLFKGGIPPVTHKAYSNNESVSVEISDSTLTVQAHEIDTAEVTVRSQDSLKSQIFQKFNVHVQPENYAPPAADIFWPSSDTLITLQGEPSEQMDIMWTRVSDRDGHSVGYTWEFSLHRDFSSETVLLSLHPDSGASSSLSYGKLDSALADWNISRGDTITTFHRVNTSDSIDITPGPAKSVPLVRGHVAPFVNVQFIHNAPRLDTVDIYLNNHRNLIHDSLTFRQATPYSEIPSGEIDLYLAKTGDAIDHSPAKSANLDPDTPYQVVINGIQEISLHFAGNRMISGERDELVATSTVHGLPRMLNETEFKLTNAENSQQLGVFGSNMQFGDVSQYITLEPSSVIFESTDHPRKFTFDLTGFGGQTLTFVTSPIPDTTNNASSLSLYTVFAFDSAGQGYLPVETTPVEKLNSEDDRPDEILLESNYPNPFNPSTEIGFALPKSTFVTLKVYNILGKEVETLINEKLDAGHHSVKFEARDLTSGIYIYRLQTPRETKTRKMMLMK